MLHRSFDRLSRKGNRIEIHWMNGANSASGDAAGLRIVLASTSPFRRALLEQLRLDFITADPDIDESRLPGETPSTLVTRLAEAKARAVCRHYPDALIIGSDQVASIDGDILGKPGSREGAIIQLQRASGRRVSFFTGLSLLNGSSGVTHSLCEHFYVHFRSLSQAKIERYLDAEQPYNCAGSFKSEGLGITLFQRLEGDDPNALIGLPLIKLVSLLAEQGIELP